MKNKKILFIVFGIIIIGFTGFYLFSNNYQSNLEKQGTSTSKELEGEEDKLNTAGEIKITDEGFNRKKITIEEEVELSIMNYSTKPVILIGDKFLTEGKELKKDQGIGFSVESLKNQNIEKMEFWLKNNPTEKIEIDVSQ